MEPVDIQGFRFANSYAARWILAPKDTIWKFAKNRLARFYENWSYDPNLKSWERVITEFGIRQDWIYTYHYDGFYIQIEKSYNAIFGPHAVRLYYQSGQVKGEVAWIAICQIEGLWHSDPKLKIALLEAINGKQFYQSEDTQEELVLF